MLSDLLANALLLLTPIAPAWVIFIWPSLSENRNARRKLRYAVTGYALSLLIASSLAYGLAASSRAERATDLWHGSPDP